MVGQPQDKDGMREDETRTLSDDDPLMELAALVGDFGSSDDADGEPAFEIEPQTAAPAKAEPDMPKVPLEEPVPDYDTSLFEDDETASDDDRPGSYAAPRGEGDDDLDRPSPTLEASPLSQPDDLPDLEESLFFDVEEEADETEVVEAQEPAGDEAIAADEPAFEPFKIEEDEPVAHEAGPAHSAAFDEPVATPSDPEPEPELKSAPDFPDDDGEFEDLEAAFGADNAPAGTVKTAASLLPDAAVEAEPEPADFDADLMDAEDAAGQAAAFEPEPEPETVRPSLATPVAADPAPMSPASRADAQKTAPALDDSLEAALLAELSSGGVPSMSSAPEAQNPVPATALSIEDELLAMLEGRAGAPMASEQAHAQTTPEAEPTFSSAPMASPAGIEPDLAAEDGPADGDGFDLDLDLDLPDQGFETAVFEPVDEQPEPQEPSVPVLAPVVADHEPAQQAPARSAGDDEDALHDFDDSLFEDVLAEFDDPGLRDTDPKADVGGIEVALDDDFSDFFSDEAIAADVDPDGQVATSSIPDPEDATEQVQSQNLAARAGAAAAGLGGLAAAIGFGRAAKSKKADEPSPEPQSDLTDAIHEQPDAALAGLADDDDIDALLAATTPPVDAARTGAEADMTLADTLERPVAKASPLDELEAIMGTPGKPLNKKGAAHMDRHSGAPVVDTVDMDDIGMFDSLDFDVPDIEPQPEPVRRDRMAGVPRATMSGMPPARDLDLDPPALFEDDQFEAEFARDLEYVRHDAAATAQRSVAVDEPAQFYADEAPAGPRSSSRKGLYVAGIIGAVALLGAASLLMFSGPQQDVSGGPVVVEADPEPVKVEPDAPGGSEVPNQDRAVFSETADNAAASQDSLVSTAEEPVAIATAPASPLPSAVNNKSEERLSVEDTASGNGGDDINLVAPRRVRTLIVRPDGTLVEQPDPAPQVASASEPATPTTSVEAGGVTFQLPAPGDAGASAEVPVRSVTTRTISPEAAPAAPEQVASAPEPAPAPAPAPTPAPTPAPAAASSPFSVQIAAVPDANAAQQTSADLQRRFASILSGRGISIQRADIDGRGTFYRVRVAADSRADANSLCERYKRAGGSCFVTR